MPVLLSGDIKRKRPVNGKAVRPPKQVEMKARAWLTALARCIKTDVQSIQHLFDDPQSAYSALGGLLRKYDTALANGLAASFAKDWGETASAIEKQKLEKQLADALGVDMAHILDDDATREAVLLSQMEAESLITSFPRDYLGDVSKAVLDNFKGKPLPGNISLTERIQEITGHKDYRARLIARDQTSKMTTALNQQRQQSVGIEEYTWRTAGDQRVVGFPGGYKPNKVHGNHYARNGKVYRWDEPPEDGAPGYAINCRCFSQPIIDPDKIKLA